MKTVTVYEASDGTRFDSQNECIKHENSIPEDDRLVELSVYDLKEDAVVIKNIDDVRKFLQEGQDWLETLVDEIWYPF